MMTDANRMIFENIVGVFGGEPSVYAYENDGFSIDVLSVSDSPCEGVTSYSTLTLSDHELSTSGIEADVRCEIVSACATDVEDFAAVIASAAVDIVNGRAIYPGAIFTDLIAMYGISETLQHVFFTSPFLWGEGPTLLELSDRQVSFLQAVPISESERAYAQRTSVDDLEAAFLQAQIDVFDIDRPSAVG